MSMTEINAPVGQNRRMSGTDSRHSTLTDELETIADRYDPSDSSQEFDFHLKRVQATAIRTMLAGNTVLELGCATGELSGLVAPGIDHYEVVEGSSKNIEVSRARVPNAIFHCSLWEDFETERRYSDILIVCALEHVDEPVPLLERSARWLAPGGRIHVIVPNADSLHRMVGVEMGLIAERTAPSESDLRIGHRRVYSIETLTRDIHTAGLEVMHWEGLFLKVLANSQMLDWDPQLIQALAVVGRRFPGNCAELYAVVTAP
jgi:trans-aconitate methyltransferase